MNSLSSEFFQSGHYRISACWLQGTGFHTRQEITDEFDAAETIRLDLRRKLPFFADDVRKLGFELPKTYGIGVIGLWQNVDIDLFDVTVGGISVV